MKFNRLIPELSVSDFSKSLHFYTVILGFSIHYQRTDPNFAFLSFAEAQLMIEQFHDSGWNVASLEKPYGRGINFQIECSNVSQIVSSLQNVSYPLYRDLKEAWRDVEGQLCGEIEFLVQDPDGYLLRFSEYLGTKIKE
jgi:catechol 2,3-dioxygenase-like lactoylglutathione lyase family enzyme